MDVFLNFSILGRGRCEIEFYFKNVTFYNVGVHKNKHWSEWATFDVYWHALEYKAPLISTSTNFLQPSRRLDIEKREHLYNEILKHMRFLSLLLNFGMKGFS